MKKLKFLLGALSFVAAAFTMTPSQAQIKTYLSEDFSSKDGLNASVWNLDACTMISQNEGYLYYLLYGTANVAGWMYDPTGLIVDGGIKTELNGRYEIISNPIQLDSNINLIYVDYMYSAQSAGNRSFGIRIKEENDSAWTTLSRLGEMGTESEGRLVSILDSKWRGKKVIMEVYFYTTHKAGVAYYFMMKEINFSSYNEDLSVATEISAFPMTYGETFDVTLSTANTCAISIDNVEYAYTIDDSVKTGTIPIIFGYSLSPMNGLDTRSIKIDVKGLDFGEHTLKILPPSKINGKSITSTQAPLELKFTMLDESLLTQNYVPLMECFTASWCGPCATMNRYLNPTLKELKDDGSINVIKYQSSGDKYYIAASEDRYEVYSDFDGYGYIPFPIYNAESNIQYWNNNFITVMNLLREKAHEAHQQKAFISIDINKADADAKTKQLELSFSVKSSFTGKLSVFAAVTEKTTTKNKGTNGETEFHWVTMDMPTTGAGKLIDFEAGKPQIFNYTVNMLRTHMEEITDLEVVCFIQDLETRKIFQSASASVTVNGVSTTNEDNEAALIKMYPNPAKGQVTLQGMSAADITICDLTGRAVYSVKGAEESLNINLDSFTAGTYMVLISQNGQTAHKKLVVVK